MTHENTINIRSLQSLRAISFISIFLTHAFNMKGFTPLALSIFFVLSGFLFGVKENNIDKEKVTFKYSFKYAVNKIKKLYPLHFVTMIADIILYCLMFHYNGLTIRKLMIFLFQIITNIFLVQSWVPVGNTIVSLNGVAWFLSVLFFLYISFPAIDKVLKNQTRRQRVILCFLLPFFELIIINVYVLIFGKTSESFGWFMYRNAFIRLFDIIMGYSFGKMYCDGSLLNISSNLATIIEVALTFINIFLSEYYGSLSLPWKGIISGERAVYYVILSSLWIYMFAINKGLITRLLSNKLFIWIGDLSSFAFLIHYPVIQYTNFFFSILPYQFSLIMKNSIMAIDFIITIALSYLWRKMIFKIRRKQYD